MARRELDISPLETDDHLYFLWAVGNLEATGQNVSREIEPSEDFHPLPPVRKEMDRLKGLDKTFLETFFLGTTFPTVNGLIEEFRENGFIHYSTEGNVEKIELGENGRIALERILEKNAIDPAQHLPPEKSYGRFR